MLNDKADIGPILTLLESYSSLTWENWIRHGYGLLIETFEIWIGQTLNPAGVRTRDIQIAKRVR